jgi:transcriptional regulator with XRE-family HTH domain
MREDAGISQRRIAADAGIDHAHWSQVERGIREPSITMLTTIGAALGADVSVRLYQRTGPRLRDGIQARILEEFLSIVNPGWDRLVEVPVSRPARGVIDAVLVGPSRDVVVTIEVQSELRRLEQLIRWTNEKSMSIPSAAFWERMSGDQVVVRLLVVRSTRANREVVERFKSTLEAVYPGRSSDAHSALTTSTAAFDSTLLWARVDGDAVTLLERPPRGISLGR